MNRSIPIKERWKIDNEMMFYFNIESRTLPMILGSIVGDALGVPVEYKPHETNTSIIHDALMRGLEDIKDSITK